MKKSEYSSKEWHKLLNELRDKLIYQAGLRQTISYGDLCHRIFSFSLQPDDEALHTALGEISESEFRAGNGLLRLVCGGSGKKYKMPGREFFNMANDLGVRYNNRSDFVQQGER